MAHTITFYGVLSELNSEGKYHANSTVTTFRLHVADHSHVQGLLMKIVALATGHPIQTLLGEHSIITLDVNPGRDTIYEREIHLSVINRLHDQEEFVCLKEGPSFMYAGVMEKPAFSIAMFLLHKLKA
ncbi:hypothetical protein KBC40_00190 [Patescibacteria group bacterium]|nr:hypothetical protein [Patescibacteria group bacterium]